MLHNAGSLRAHRSVALCLSLLSFAIIAPAKVLYVKTGGTGDGSSWENAAGTISAVVSAAANRDEIWVAAGTYDEKLVLDRHLDLYGGFTGTETDRSERDDRTNVTKIRSSWVVAQNGTSIVTISAPVTLDGFTITDGTARYGGGISTSGPGVFIQNNIITGNNAISTDAYLSDDSFGGGIYVVNGDPLITRNRISDNWASPSGGGIYVQDGSPNILDNIIANNHAGSFTNHMNLHLGGGGGIATSPNAFPYIQRNTITGNTSTSDSYLCDPSAISSPRATVTNNIIIHNVSSFSHAVTAAILDNNTIVDNTDTQAGSGYSAYAEIDAVNNIIAFNNAGLGVPDGIAATAVRNNDVHANTSGSYKGITDQTGQNGNISADPLFKDRASDDYHLQPASPCIDAGDNSVAFPGTLDRDGDPRKLHARVDIGADEVIIYTPPILAGAVPALRKAAGLTASTPDVMAKLDTDANHLIDVRDAITLLRQSVGLQ